MSYVAVSGGTEAIANAADLARYLRVRGQSTPLSVEQIKDQLRLSVDKVMGEGGLYAPTIAALALKQAEGDTIEASFIVRAYRSTQPRRYRSCTVDTREMQVIRRVSAAFQDIPGGQILGPTRDYTQRLVDFSLSEETAESIKDFLTQINLDVPPAEIPDSYPKVVDLLRREGLMVPPKEQPETAQDITLQTLRFPCPRSARLQTLARGETGAMMALAYSSVRGYGDIHPCLGELRVGYVPIYLRHVETSRSIYLGRILMTEVEVIAKYVDSEPGDIPRLTLGYGLCFGHNELKAMSMAILDRSMQNTSQTAAPAEDPEFVLQHIDGIEASGFVTHFKLPHYVTFQSTLDRLRKSQDDANNGEEADHAGSDAG